MLRAGGPRLLAPIALALLMGAGAVGCAHRGDLAEPVVTAPTGWQVSVYHTAVERFHDGPPRRVTGCVVVGCSARRDHIGYYPSDFVDAVEFVGSGRLETGRYAGKYLNWSPQVGFWIDDFARDSQGGVLVPFASAAADPDVLALGTVFELAGCGVLEDGTPVPTAVCDQLRAPQWTIADEIDAAITGDRRIDLYVGDETLETFANGEFATNFFAVELTMEDGAVPNPFDPDASPDPGPVVVAPPGSSSLPAPMGPTAPTTGSTGSTRPTTTAPTTSSTTTRPARPGPG